MRFVLPGDVVEVQLPSKIPFALVGEFEGVRLTLTESGVGAQTVAASDGPDPAGEVSVAGAMRWI